MDRRHAYALSAIATMVAVSLLELGSVVLKHPWQDVTPWWSYANSILTVVVVSVAALAMALRNVGAPFLGAAWWLGYVSAGYLVIHALTMRESGSYIALLEVPIGLALILFVRRAITPADPAILSKHPHLRLPRLVPQA